MMGQSTNNISFSSKLNLNIGLYNVENLFLLFKDEPGLHFEKLTEIQWQKLSNSSLENKSLEKCTQIAQIIKNNNVDIMMLCEIGGLESLNNFNKYFLNNQYHVALIEGNSDRNIDVGYLIKKDVNFFFDIATNKKRLLNHSLPQKNSSQRLKTQLHYFSRDCAELRLFKTTKDSPFMILLLTHLKSRLDPERIDPGGTEKRGAELRTLIEIYKELKSQYPNVPIILSGDFNGYAGKPCTDTEFLPLYTDTDLEDALEVANLSVEKRSTFYQIKGTGHVEGKQIDYCFLSKNLIPNFIKSSAQVYRYKDEFGFEIDTPKNSEAKSRLASDHYPLFFSLENIKI